MTKQYYTLSGDPNCASYSDSFSGIVSPIHAIDFLDANLFGFSFTVDNSDSLAFITKDWGVSAFPSSTVIDSLLIKLNSIVASSAETVTVHVDVCINVDPGAGLYDVVLGAISNQDFVLSKSTTDVELVFPVSTLFSSTIKTAILNANFGIQVSLSTGADSDVTLDQLQFGIEYSESRGDSTFRNRGGNRDRLAWGAR